jgi:hypothetical protein
MINVKDIVLGLKVHATLVANEVVVDCREYCGAKVHVSFHDNVASKELNLYLVGLYNENE